MRLLILTAAVAAISFPAFAQQGRPQQQQRPPAQQQQAAPPPQEAAPAPGMFACRTEAEVCYIGIVTGKGQVQVLYSNDPKAEGIEEKPINAGPTDLTPHLGKVVMIVGAYSAQGGLSNVEVVDVAGPLLSFAIKSMLSGSGEEEEEEPEPPPPPQKQQPKRR
jgi:hypothetical protein